MLNDPKTKDSEKLAEVYRIVHRWGREGDIHTFVGYPSREEASPVGPLPSNKADTVEIPPRAVVAVEIFA